MSVFFPGNGKCCLSKVDKDYDKRKSSTSRPKSSSSSLSSSSVSRKCPGVCIPQMMSSVCNEVLDRYKCDKGTVCCKSNDDDDDAKKRKEEEEVEEEENKRKERTTPRPKRPPPRRPPPSTGGKGPDLTKVFGTLLNAATGSSREEENVTTIVKDCVTATGVRPISAVLRTNATSRLSRQ